MATSCHEDGYSEESLPASEDMVREITHDDQPLTFSQMTQIAADIKRSFTAAITDLKIDLYTLSEQMMSHKRAGIQRDKAISRLKRVSETHSSHLIAISRHLEDLVNRGRRNNIRVTSE